MVGSEFSPIDLAADPSPRSEPGEERHPLTVQTGLVLIGVSSVWSGPLRKKQKCPCCSNKPSPNHYCICCDRFGGDGMRKLPGLPVGKYLDPDYQDTEGK